MGLCVATGVVEGGCKNIVASRLKRGGMHWTVAGANAIMAPAIARSSGKPVPTTSWEPPRKWKVVVISQIWRAPLRRPTVYKTR